MTTRKPLPKWMRKLPAHLRQHAREFGPALWKVKLNIQHQRQQGIECHDCAAIARRLGV